MFSSLIRQRTTVLNLVLALLLGTTGITARAESPAPSTPPATPSASDTTFATPQLTPPTMPNNSEKMDRARAYRKAANDEQNQANQQRIMCLLMMLTPETMPLGLMQCMQAEETEKSAKENRDSARDAMKADASDVPKQAELKAPPPPEVKSPKEDDNGQKEALMAALREASGSPAPEATETVPESRMVADSAPLPAAVVPPPAATESPAAPQAPVAPPAAKPKALSPIDSAKLGYDRRGDDASLPPPTSPNYPPTAGDGHTRGAGGPAAEAAAPISAARNDVAFEKAARRGTASEGGGGTGGGGEESRPEGGGASADLLSQLLGGGPKSDSVADAGGLGVIQLPRKGVDETVPNIFEYASWRFKKIANPEPGVRVKAKAKPKRQVMANSFLRAD